MQILQARLAELSVAQLAECIRAEINDNPALEPVQPDDRFDNDYDEPHDDSSDDDFDTQREREERQSQLDDALSNLGDDDELPVYGNSSANSSTSRDPAYEPGESFYDTLTLQMMETELTPLQREIMEYVVGSLDDDGWLRKDNVAIADELAVYHNLDVSTSEIENVIKKLQQFDPAGIGARSLQECLMLQVERRSDSLEKRLMKELINKHFDEFVKKRWDKIQHDMEIDDSTAQRLRQEMTRLNPKPGASLGAYSDDAVQQITPDVYIDTHDDGTVSFALNNGDAPDLAITSTFIDMVRQDNGNADAMSRQMREALLYARNKVDLAQRFIEALKIRRDTLTTVVRAIIHHQHDFFEDGDDSSLHAMRLKDIAEKTGLDISTVSRVCNGKYAQTRWGIFPFRHFFSDGYVTDDGEEMSTRRIKAVLQDIIDGEDKNAPLSDEALTRVMEEKGFPIARRTVAKYREQMGIPVARMRK